MRRTSTCTTSTSSYSRIFLKHLNKFSLMPTLIQKWAIHFASNQHLQHASYYMVSIYASFSVSPSILLFPKALLAVLCLLYFFWCTRVKLCVRSQKKIMACQPSQPYICTPEQDTAAQTHTHTHELTLDFFILEERKSHPSPRSNKIHSHRSHHRGRRCARAHTYSTADRTILEQSTQVRTPDQLIAGAGT